MYLLFIRVRITLRALTARSEYYIVIKFLQSMTEYLNIHTGYERRGTICYILT